MAHVAGHVYTKSRVKQSDEWLSVASAIGALANKYSRRNDLVALVADGAGMGAPACFIPATAEVEISKDKLLHGVSPLAVDLATEEGRLARVALVGAVIHEASHARNSLWTSPDPEKDLTITKRVLDVMTILEESRIEALMLAKQPERSTGDEMNRERVGLYLRACALEIIVKDFRIAETRYGAAAGAGLTLARVSSGVLDEVDVADLRAKIEEVIEPEVIAQLTEVWTEFQSIQTAKDEVSYSGEIPRAVRRMVALAKRWLEIIGVDPEDDADDLAAKSELRMKAKSESGDGDPGEGDPSGEDGEGGEGNAPGSSHDGSLGEGEATLAEMIADAAGTVATETDSEATVLRAAERDSRVVATRAEDHSRKKEHEGESAKVFPRDHGYGGDAIRTHLGGRRAPTGDERRAAVSLAKRLESVQYRDRVVHKRTSEAPPGRLRPRAAVARASEKARGAMMVSQPWQAKRRVHTDETPLTVGLLTDLSGSMGAAERPMGVIGWMLPEAMSRVTGSVASVLFGARVYGVVKPGTRMDEVLQWRAMDGTEKFKPAFQALDGVLNLLHGEGARLLVIASDGQFVEPKHAAYATKMMALCRDKGVGVIWLDFDSAPGSSRAYRYCDNHGFGETVPVGGLDAVAIATAVGDAAVRALAFAGRGA